MERAEIVKRHFRRISALEDGNGASARSTAPISLRPLKDSIDELVVLYTQSQESAERLTDAIKATAEKSGLLATVVRKFVKARAGNKLEEEKRAAEQLSLVFEELT